MERTQFAEVMESLIPVQKNYHVMQLVETVSKDHLISKEE